MVDFAINTGIRKIADSILTEVAKNIDEEWFAEDITVLLSSANVLATLVVDFAYDISSIIEYTLNSGDNWIAFNSGDAIAGGQSLFIEVTTGALVNFRAKIGGNLVRCIVSSVP